MTIESIKFSKIERKNNHSQCSERGENFYLFVLNLLLPCVICALTTFMITALTHIFSNHYKTSAVLAVIAASILSTTSVTAQIPSDNLARISYL